MLLFIVFPLLGLAQPKEFVFTNFDNAEVTLSLVLDQQVIGQGKIWDAQWLHNNKYPNTPTGNYLAIVEGMFRTNQPQLRFLYDLFEQATQGSTETYLVQTVIRFVQSLPYQLPPTQYKNQQVIGILPPLIALQEGYGDCDTKSLLLVCILSHRMEVLYLFGAKHAFIGIPISPTLHQQFVTIDGQQYVLCEMTGKWSLGQLPTTSIQEINQGNYQYILFP